MIVSLAFTLVLVLHGAIHLMGVSRAFGWGEVPLQKVMGPGEGVLWGVAALLFAGAAVACWLVPRWWWLPALAGVVVSQALIVGAWDDARWGTLANLVVVLPALLAAADVRPGSLRSRYEAEVARVQGAAARPRAESAGPGTPVPGAVVREADLAGLPAPVARWMRHIGVVGEPVPATLQAAYRIRIRGGADEGWMAGRGEQFTRIDPPLRLFYMTARKAGLPVAVLHRYVDGAATMEGRLLGVIPLFERGGDEMTRSETVTLLNDLFFLAPAGLLATELTWHEMDDERARVTWRHAGHTVTAEVVFDEAGDLVDFISDDRWQMDRDPPARARWRTPFSVYGHVDGVRLPVAGQGWWGEGEAAWPYVEIEVRGIDYAH
jgi:hypothetical protein